MSDRSRTLIVALILSALAVFVGREVYLRLIVPAAPLNFDEAAHSLPGHYILRDILKFDVRAFWGDFHIQTLWPPGFSLMQAPFLGLLGRSDETARLFAYIMLVLTMLMGCAIAYAIRSALAPIASLVSGLMMLTAPSWLYVSSWAMQETPVAFVVFVVFWLFLRALKTRKTIWFFATGCALFFLFITKYNYAAFALIAIAVVDLGERIRELRMKNAELRKQSSGSSAVSILNSQFSILALYAPFIVGLLFWFFGGTDISPTAVKWRDFRFFVANEDSGYPFWSEQNLLFYVRVMLNSLMPHPLLAIASVLGAAWAIARIRHPGVTLLALFFTIGFVLATLHQLKADRYITPIFPSLWVLTGLGAADLIRRLTTDDRRPLIVRRLSSVVFIVILSGISVASWLTWLPRLEPVWAGNVADDMRAATNQIVKWQKGGQPVLIIGTFGEISPPLFEWRLRPLPAFATDGNIQYDAPPVEGQNDIERVQNWLDQNPGTQVTLIEVDNQSPLYNTSDMKNKNAWKQEIVRQFDHVKGYRLVDQVEFPKSRITISYWLSE